MGTLCRLLEALQRLRGRPRPSFRKPLGALPKPLETLPGPSGSPYEAPGGATLRHGRPLEAPCQRSADAPWRLPEGKGALRGAGGPVAGTLEGLRRPSRAPWRPLEPGCGALSTRVAGLGSCSEAGAGKRQKPPSGAIPTGATLWGSRGQVLLQPP